LTKEINPKGGNMKKENEEKRQIYGQQYYQKKNLNRQIGFLEFLSI